MVIKEISSMGADVKAGNELDFREIFRDSRQHLRYLHHHQLHFHRHDGDLATMNTNITMMILMFTIMITREQMTTRRRSCILVEGSPGYGKTTLARKIAADWGEKAG